MTTFFTSDTHFGHKNIIEYCDRPFKDIYHMDNTLVNNWNSVVAPDDTVYHLGDVALGNWERWDEILSSLNGINILVIGNHDRIFGHTKQAMKDRFAPKYAKWFEGGLYSANTIMFDGQAVELSHFPYDGDSHGEDRYQGDRLTDKGVPLIHGHTHGTEHATVSKKGTPMFHVGVDAHDFRPVHEDVIRDWLSTL